MTWNVDARAYSYAVDVVHSVCCLAAVPSYVDDLRNQLRQSGAFEAVRYRDTARGCAMEIIAGEFVVLRGSITALVVRVRHPSIGLSSFAYKDAFRGA